MMDGLLGKCRTALLDLLFPPKCAFCGKLLDIVFTGITGNTA